MPTPTYNPLGTPSINVGSTTFNPNAPLFGTTNTNVSTTSTASTASNSSAQMGADKNASSGLNSLLNLASQGAQIAGSIRYQRQQSGASARRQSLIAQCGRRPLFGRERKEEYRKCKADYEASLLTPVGSQVISQDDVNKNIGGQGGSMRFVLIGVGVLAIGAIAYLALRKK